MNDSRYTPYMLYVLVEGEKLDINLATLPTELLLPIQQACKLELYTRSLKVDFRSEREAMNAVIEPKQLTLIFKR